MLKFICCISFLHSNPTFDVIAFFVSCCFDSDDIISAIDNKINKIDQQIVHDWMITKGGAGESFVVLWF